MKKLILLLLGSVSIAIGMKRTELPVKIVNQNSFLQPTDENLSHILLSGSKDELKKMLDARIIKSTRIFLNKLFNEKSLLQATLELQASHQTGKENRYEIARMLLEKGADRRDLDTFLIPAVKAADEKLVQLLVEYGVKDPEGKAAELANQLENSAHLPAIKKQALARIKTLLPGRSSLLTPIVMRAK